MDRFRPYKSPGSDRFLGILPSSSAVAAVAAAAAAAEGGFELHEDELFASAPDPPDPTPRPPHSLPFSLRNPNPNPNPSPLSSSRRPTDGILAALPEDFTRFSPKHGAAAGASFLRPRPYLSSSSSSSSSSSASTSPASYASSSSAARMIPSIPRPRPEFALSVPGGRIHRHSAPVNVPVANRSARSGSEELEEEDEGEDEMLPPHEMVARARSKHSPLRASSMLEGAGRTLKGRDQRQVRDAIWRKMGFMD